MINPYQEMPKCPDCNSIPNVMDGYNWLYDYHVILVCSKSKCKKVYKHKIIGGAMRQSIQKELGLLKEDITTKVREVKPYTRKIKHKQNFLDTI